MRATAALPTPDELADFFGELRQAGCRLDPRQLAAAERLLLMVHAREPQSESARLKTLLAPVFVTPPAQQADFYGRFDIWVGRRGGGGPVVIGQDTRRAGRKPDRELDVHRERSWRWGLIVGAAGLLLAIGVGTWWFMVQEQPARSLRHLRGPLNLCRHDPRGLQCRRHSRLCRSPRFSSGSAFAGCGAACGLSAGRVAKCRSWIASACRGKAAVRLARLSLHRAEFAPASPGAGDGS